MPLVHQRDFGVPGKSTRFLLRRAVRILPMLWTVLCGLALAHVMLPTILRTTFSPRGFVADVLLLPYPGDRLLNAIWTLKKEALFYAVFALAIFRPRWGIPTLMVWQLCSLLNAVFLLVPGFYGLFFFDAYNIGFGTGMLAALAYQHLPHNAWISRVCAVFGAAAFIGVAAWEWTLGHMLPPTAENPIGVELEPALQVVAAATMLYGLLDLERAGHLRLPKWATVAGALSYALYLLHEPLISLAAKVAERLHLSVEAFYVGTSLFVVSAVAVIHYGYERPLQKFLTRLERRFVRE